MGIVYKKTIKGTVILYISIVIGFINTGLIFPKVLSTEQIGLLNIIISYAQILSLVGNLGFSNTILKFFPYFKNRDKSHNGFLKIIIIVSFIGFLLSVILFFVLKQLVFNADTEKSALFIEYIYLIIPLTFFTIYFNALDTYYRALFNSVSGIFYKEFLTRLLVLILIILYLYKVLNFDLFVITYIAIYSLPAFGILFSIFLSNELKVFRAVISFKRVIKKAMIKVSLYSFLPGLSGVILVNIDKIMIERFNGLSDLGVYSIAFFFGTLVAIPSRSLLRISSTIIAEAWKKNDINKISEIYTKSSINQFIIGILILIGIWINIDNVFEILPKQYTSGKYVILIIGLAFLSDMIGGTSIQVISLSRYYKYQTYFIIIFILLAFVFNIILIPKYGILGAAISTFLSRFLFNVVRILFIKLKFKLWPLNYKSWYILIIATLSYLLSISITKFNNVYFDIFVRSLIASIMFIFLIIRLKVSEDINNIFDKTYKILKNRLLQIKK